MKRFARKLFVFGITCLGASITLLFVERLILNNKGQFKLGKSEKYIFLGHSHPQVAYDDHLIDSSLNKASSGEAYFYTYVKLQEILKNNRDQKVIFIEYSNNNIVAEMNNWIWDDIHIQDMYKLYSAYCHFDDVKLLYSKNPKSTLVCNVKSLINNIYYIFNLNNISADSLMGGYYDLVRDKTDSLVQALSKNPEQIVHDTAISYANVAYLRKAIDACRENGDRVYLIRSPLHPKYQGFWNEKRYRDLLEKEFKDVEFLDFKNYSLPDSDFGDLEHLNYRGARKYSTFFNKLLKSGLLEKGNKQKYIDEQISIEKNRN